jgi:hypothetical protein
MEFDNTVWFARTSEGRGLHCRRQMEEIDDLLQALLPRTGTQVTSGQTVGSAWQLSMILIYLRRNTLPRKFIHAILHRQSTQCSRLHESNYTRCFGVYLNYSSAIACRDLHKRFAVSTTSITRPGAMLKITLDSRDVGTLSVRKRTTICGCVHSRTPLVRAFHRSRPRVCESLAVAVAQHNGQQAAWAIAGTAHSSPVAGWRFAALPGAVCDDKTRPQCMLPFWVPRMNSLLAALAGKNAAASELLRVAAAVLSGGWVRAAGHGQATVSWCLPIWQLGIHPCEPSGALQ